MYPERSVTYVSGRSLSEPTSRNIRSAIMKDKSLSTYAHNIKVIAQDGTVTLKGPVHTETEKQTLVAKATQIAGDGKVNRAMAPSVAHSDRVFAHDARDRPRRWAMVSAGGLARVGHLARNSSRSSVITRYPDAARPRYDACRCAQEPSLHPRPHHSERVIVRASPHAGQRIADTVRLGILKSPTRASTSPAPALPVHHQHSMEMRTRYRRQC